MQILFGGDVRSVEPVPEIDICDVRISSGARVFQILASTDDDEDSATIGHQSPA